MSIIVAYLTLACAVALFCAALTAIITVATLIIASPILLWEITKCKLYDPNSKFEKWGGLILLSIFGVGGLVALVKHLLGIQ